MFCFAEPVFFLVIVRGTRLLPSDPSVGLHCEHHPASTVVHDFEQRTMSTSANRASDALGMGPSVGYNLISMITTFFIFTISICMSCLHAVVFVSDIHIHIYVVTNLLMLYFWIKLIIKMSNYLTKETTPLARGSGAAGKQRGRKRSALHSGLGHNGLGRGAGGKEVTMAAC